jgi:methionyl-tRNA formyltransferase
MTILFLGPDTSPVCEFLRRTEPAVIDTTQPLHHVNASEVSFIVSHGYEHLLRARVLDALPGRVINLHASYLPWGRGTDPNLWSWVEGTPKGVTIHYVDEGVDTGDLIAQRCVLFGEGATLRTTYDALQSVLCDLFVELWPDIRAGRCPRVPQPTGGTVHRLRDRERVAHVLAEHGWDTPVARLEEYAAETQMAEQFWAKYDREVIA